MNLPVVTLLYPVILITGNAQTERSYSFWMKDFVCSSVGLNQIVSEVIHAVFWMSLTFIKAGSFGLGIPFPHTVKWNRLYLRHLLFHIQQSELMHAWGLNLSMVRIQRRKSDIQVDSELWFILVLNFLINSYMLRYLYSTIIFDFFSCPALLTKWYEKETLKGPKWILQNHL